MASRIFIDGDSKFLRSLIQIFRLNPGALIQVKVNGEMIDLQFDSDSMILSFFLNGTWNPSSTPLGGTIGALKAEIMEMM
jgi:hypothetical protein